MPIYEYRCAACGHHLEALQKMTEGPLRKCPDCGKSQLKRLVSASRFRLKGSGWYETDFKNKGETQRNLVEKGGGESTRSGERQVDRRIGEGRSRQGRRGRKKRRCGREAREAETCEQQNRVADTNETCGQAARKNLAPLTRSRPRRVRARAARSSPRARLRALRLRRNIPPSSRLTPPLHSKG